MAVGEQGDDQVSDDAIGAFTAREMFSLSREPRSAISIGSSLGVIAIAPWYAPPQPDWGAAGTGTRSAMASDAKKVSVEDARQEVARGDAVAVDVRSKEEWSKGHVPGAIHFPEGGNASDRTDRLEDGARLMVIAKNGSWRSGPPQDLSARGYDAVPVDGGMDDWARTSTPSPPRTPTRTPSSA